MLRRSIWTAAVAVTIALVAPSTSQAQFSVQFNGLANSGAAAGQASQVQGNSGTLTDTAGGLLPGSSNPGFTGLGATSNNSAAGLAIVTPPISAISYASLPSNAVGLLGNAGPGSNNGGSLPAGVYVSATFTSAVVGGGTDAFLDTLSQAYVYNDTNHVETISLVVTSQFTQPGAPGSILSVSNSLATVSFRTASDAKQSSDPYDSVSAVGSSPQGNTSAAATASPTNIPGDPPTFFSLTYPQSGPYTLVQTITIVLDAGNAVQFEATLDGTALSAPAPGGLILVVAGAPFFGLLRRRMTRAASTIA